MDLFTFQLESPRVISRLPALFRLLGLIGLLSFPLGGTLREQTGKTQLQSPGGVEFVGHVESWYIPGEAPGYHLESGEVHTSSPLFQILDDAALALRTSAGPEGQVIPGAALARYRLVRVLESVEAPAYAGGPKITWKKIRGLDGTEGFAAVTLSPDLTAKSPARLYIHAEDVQHAGPEVRYTAKGLATLPLRILLVFNVVWVLHLPALILFLSYQLAGVFLTALNLLHALVLERNHREFQQFVARVIYFRLKILVSLMGSGGPIPHVDIHARERERMTLRFGPPIEDAMPRAQAISRLLAYAGIIALLVMGPGLLASLGGIPRIVALVITGVVGFLLLLPAIVYAIVQLAIWATEGTIARVPVVLLQVQGRLLRLALTIELFALGFITSPLAFKQAFASPVVNRAGEVAKDRFDPGPGSKVEMNLVVLILCIGLSFGLYSLCWLARTAKTMGDEPFTILLVSVFGAGLPLSFLFSRYYRRTELLQRSNASILVELLVMVPGVNLLLGAFVVQYGLNALARAQAKAET